MQKYNIESYFKNLNFNNIFYHFEVRILSGQADFFQNKFIVE